LANQCKARIVECHAARPSVNSTVDEPSLAIEAKQDEHGALLAAWQRGSWILLLALELSDNLQLPRLDRSNMLGRAPWRRSGESRTAAAEAGQE
jgi:hypothetical protein